MQNTRELADWRVGFWLHGLDFDPFNEEYAMELPFEYKKDGVVRAFLYDGEPLGDFTAYRHMVVTEPGRKAGMLVNDTDDTLNDLNHRLGAGDVVEAPTAKQIKDSGFSASRVLGCSFASWLAP